MPREIRYQGAIIKDDQILLILNHILKTEETYWLLPGGGILDGETEEACIIREMKEETNLDVKVERLILDEPTLEGDPYPWAKTYLCHPVGGVEGPGYEPEPEVAGEYTISQVKWFDLRDATIWELKLLNDPITYPTLQKIRKVLGYDT